MGALISFVTIVVQLYSFLIIGRVLLSWINIDPYSPVAQFIIRLTEPVLAPIRNIMPQTGPLDFSPIVALLLVQLLGQILIAALSSVA